MMRRLFSRHAAPAVPSSPSLDLIQVTHQATTENCLTRVVLNRPTKLNALNVAMVRDLVPVLASLRPNSCLLMEGAGERAFCAGGDVATVRQEAVEGRARGVPADFFFEEYHVDYWLAKLKNEMNMTQVSVWNGICMGGGVGISIHGAIRIATEKTVFSMPEVAIGLFPDVGGTHALPRLPAGREIGLYLGLTGVRIGAADCLWSGLATHYVPSDRLEDLRRGLRSLGAKCDATDVINVIERARGGAEPPVGSSKAFLADTAQTIKECFSAPSVEAILDRLQNTANSSSKHAAWADTTRKSMLKMSPLALKLTFEAMKRHGQPEVSLFEAFKTEYRLSQRAVQAKPKSDFLEGVRATLVDKNAPVWSHQSVTDVTKAEIDAYFEPLPSDHPRGEFHGDVTNFLK